MTEEKKCSYQLDLQNNNVEETPASFHTCPTCGTVISKIPGNEPVRIQRKRAKGWRMPENTVCVTRPGKFGNPFKIVRDQIFGDASHRRGKLLNPWVLIDIDPVFYKSTPLNKIVIELYKDWIHGVNINHLVPAPSYDAIKSALYGKNLACFCKIGAPCHADILLKIANS